MAVKLRLQRMGKTRQPVYKVVAADVRAPRDGKFIEAIGLYNPKTEPATVDIKEDRALYWLSVGAQPTDTVKNLLSRKGVLLKKELVKQGLSEEEIASKIDEFLKLKEVKTADLVKAKAEAAAKAKKAAEEAKKKAEEEARKEEEAKAKEEAAAAAAAAEAQAETSEEKPAEEQTETEG